MAKQLTCITIFISGTSEAEAEKAALKRVLDELTGVLEKTHNVTLRMIGWPETIRPGVGTDPQNVINQQIGGGYDIYVGVLGSRFGQATPRAGSGTEEEFNVALDRFRQDSAAVRVLFYFNRVAQDPFTLDLQQVQKVRTFRNNLAPTGVLFFDFNDIADFTEKVRNHLHHLIVDEWEGEAWKEVNPVQPSALNTEVAISSCPVANASEVAEPGEIEEEELGLMEIMKEFEDSTQALPAALSQIGDQIKLVGQKLESRTGESNQLEERQRQLQQVAGSREKQDYSEQAKAIADQAAIDIDEFATGVAASLHNFNRENRAMFDHLRRVMFVQREFSLPLERLRQDREALRRLIEIITDGQSKAMEFQRLMSQMPPLTSRLRKARKQASAILGELIAELQFSIQEGTRIGAEMLSHEEGVSAASPTN